MAGRDARNRMAIATLLNGQPLHGLKPPLGAVPPVSPFPVVQTSEGAYPRKDTLKRLQERLKTEGVYASPVDGELNAQTEAALRQYQQQHGLPVSGTVDEATLQQLQLRLPTTPGGER
jgi:peptidoglycan hydrolase-like protein with peptidoglycan-binding domain